MFDLHGVRRYNKYILAVIVLCVCLILLPSDTIRAAWRNENETVLVIDAGHGGIDGGAIGADGTRESEINLSIALKLDALAALFGQRTIMTRTEDVSLSDENSYSEHEDLVLRTKLASSVTDAILFSIHQNCYITPQPKGYQIFYATNGDSERIGKNIHENFRKYIEPENRRVAEPAPKKLYITANAACPSVLIECGFMSNPQDLEKLKCADHQTAIAAVLLKSYMEFNHT